MFIYRSTCFGRPHAHHQELDICSSSLWFYLRSVVIAVLLFMFGPVINGLTTNTCHHDTEAKPEVGTAVDEAPDDGHEDAQNMLRCK
jgi:hypothetical protein